MKRLAIICLLLLIPLLAQQCDAQSTTMLMKDVYPGPAGSSPNYFRTINGTLYFRGADPIHGTELWKSDGTPGGTKLIKDIYPGPLGSGLEQFTELNGMLYFSATDGVYGTELWRSDGSEEGTIMVKDIYPGAAGSSPWYLTELNGMLYMRASDPTYGTELWKSDGSEGGTFIVKDLYSGAASSSPTYITKVGSLLFFNGFEATYGSEPYRSDGTFSGTFLLKDICSGTGGSFAAAFSDINGTAYFQAYEPSTGSELWKSDGTTVGTSLVKDIYAGGGSASPAYMTSLGAMCYFSAYNPANGNELWKSDGTSGGTVLVKDVNPGSGSGNPSEMIEYHGALYFSAIDATSGWELWSSDGTSAGTVLVKDIYPGSNSSSPSTKVLFDDKFYFTARDGITGAELWKSDGTGAGTALVADAIPGASGVYPQNLYSSSRAIYFMGATTAEGNEVWTHYPNEHGAAVTSVSDIPNDQGGQVRLSWQKSLWDSIDGGGHVTSYGVWRKIPPSVAATRKSRALPPEGLSVLVDSLSLYDFLQVVPAMRIPSYSVVVPTLEDSTADGLHETSFLITAQTTDPNYYYVSSAMAGYSVDDLAPIVPAGVLATTDEGGASITLVWDRNLSDPDLKSYRVFRSTDPAFLPSTESLVATVGTNQYRDESPELGHVNYYRVTAMDVHGNESAPSGTSGTGALMSQSFGVQAKWNMVSVPLMMHDFAKTSLFPAAVSSAYAYEDGYVASPTMENGRAYWIKFSEATSISHMGLMRGSDTVAVKAGWNMIGALSATVATSSIGSIPSGMATSSFFAYAGSYTISTALEPGRGYWVKSAQDGLLVMAAGEMMPASQRIRIADTGELPPPPPDGRAGLMPEAFALDQNYPNPFNPSTVIRYALPTETHVRLTVFNVIGQEVAVLVDGVESEGFKTVTFSASSLPSGVYAYRLSAGSSVQTRQMLILK